MKAWIYRRYGGPEVLEWAERPDPAPGRGELGVKVVAASVNPLDWKLPAGEFRLMTLGRLPRGLGFDVAGVVDAVGEGVSGWRAGEAVVAIANPITSRLGTFAERCCVPAANAVRKPEALAFVDAAALPGSGITAVQALAEAGLAAGQRVLVLGASGGVGSFAVQLARIAGASVPAVAGAAAQAHLATRGAERCLDRSREDWRALAERFDIVFDCSGVSTLAEGRRVLAPAGAYAQILPNARFWFGAQWLRLTSRQRCILVMEKPNGEDLATLVGLAASGRLRAPVTRIAAMGEVPAVIGAMRAGHNQGKTVIRAEPGDRSTLP